jgi:hypothetical protein
MEQAAILFQNETCDGAQKNFFRSSMEIPRPVDYLVAVSEPLILIWLRYHCMKKPDFCKLIVVLRSRNLRGLRAALARFKRLD